MMKLSERIKHFLISEEGPTAVEYALMLALLVLFCIGTINMLGQYANGTFQQVEEEMRARGTGS